MATVALVRCAHPPPKGDAPTLHPCQAVSQTAWRAAHDKSGGGADATLRRLTPRQLEPSFPDHGVVAVGHAGHRHVQVRQARGCRGGAPQWPWWGEHEMGGWGQEQRGAVSVHCRCPVGEGRHGKRVSE
jgi:hypothetical protein